ncbi:MAG: hypothetical protein WKF55_07525 [Gemmatimonadaceae bacterium]
MTQPVGPAASGQIAKREQTALDETSLPARDKSVSYTERTGDRVVAIAVSQSEYDAAGGPGGDGSRAQHACKHLAIVGGKHESYHYFSYKPLECLLC